MHTTRFLHGKRQRPALIQGSQVRRSVPVDFAVSIVCIVFCDFSDSADYVAASAVLRKASAFFLWHAFKSLGLKMFEFIFTVVGARCCNIIGEFA